MKVSEVLAAHQALQQLARTKVNINGSVQIAKALIELGLTAKITEERRLSLVEELAEHDENGKPQVAGNEYVFANGNRERFEARWQGLLAEEIDVTGKIDLDGLKNVDVEPATIAPILPLLVE